MSLLRFRSRTRARSGFYPLLGLFVTTSILGVSPLWAVPASPTGKAMAAPAGKPAVNGQTNAAEKWRQPLAGAPAALHVLGRLAFGPLPGEVEEVQRVGIRPYIEAQLKPQSIDDSTVETKLARLQLIQSPPERLALMNRGDNNAIRRYLEMRNPDSKKRARLEAAAAQKAANAANGAMQLPNADAPKSRLNQVLNQRQQQTVDEFEKAGMTPGISIRAAGELVQDKLVRAVESKRQLQEVLTDFWSNHFNIDMRKKAGRVLKITDDRTVIRPHLFGTFRELLGASAHSPAMLVYLDNASSTVEMKARGGKTRGGLNENYARELMELHTLGVDGGYTQADVTEVARCFTGWSVDPESGTFVFRPRAHDNGEKHVLGSTIPAGGGKQDAEQVLDMLAASPATAKFLSTKLCQRFVADAPPASLVDRVAQTYTRTGGDLTAVYRAIFLSPEFLSQGAYRSKIKSPFEYTVSAVRALGGTLTVPDENFPLDKLRLTRIGAISSNQGAKGDKRGQGARVPLALEIANLGQPIFACLPPTGWSEDSSNWVSAGAIVGRLNFALSLTAGTVADVRLSPDVFRAATLDLLSSQLIGGQLSDATRATIARETTASTDGSKMRALILGSPEFQRR